MCSNHRPGSIKAPKFSIKICAQNTDQTQSAEVFKNNICSKRRPASIIAPTLKFKCVQSIDQPPSSVHQVLNNYMWSKYRSATWHNS